MWTTEDNVESYVMKSVAFQKGCHNRKDVYGKIPTYISNKCNAMSSAALN